MFDSACTRASLLLGLVWSPSGAWAQSALGTDIELLRSHQGMGGFVGVSTPSRTTPLSVQTTTLVQYERDPLTLYDRDTLEEVGAVVTHRAAAAVTTSIALSERFRLALAVPLMVDWGSELAEQGSDGVGAGDTSVHALLGGPGLGPLSTGVRAAVLLPTGRASSFQGESTVRVEGGLLAMVSGGPVQAAVDLAVHGRPVVDTQADFELGPELLWNTGLRVELPAATRLDLSTTLLGRSGLAHLGGGGAENTLVHAVRSSALDSQGMAPGLS
jgi:hypothetical protein